jgi:hypothetical protein
MNHTLSDKNYANEAFQNTIEWIYGYRKYLKWVYDTFYDDNGKVDQSVTDVTTPLEYRKYEHWDSAACGLASALFVDDPCDITDVAKVILNCRGYKVKKEK